MKKLASGGFEVVQTRQDKKEQKAMPQYGSGPRPARGGFRGRGDRFIRGRGRGEQPSEG